jgi:hypothetical protein
MVAEEFVFYFEMQNVYKLEEFEVAGHQNSTLQLIVHRYCWHLLSETITLASTIVLSRNIEQSQEKGPVVFETIFQIKSLAISSILLIGAF